MGLIFFQRSDDLNPGRLGGKRKRFLCAMLSPHFGGKIVFGELEFTLSGTLSKNKFLNYFTN